MRTTSGREVVVNAAPFSPADHDHLRTFSEQVDTSFLPRPQGGLPAIAVQCRNPAAMLPAAFQAFRSVLKRLGINVAAVQAQADYEDFYYATVWTAIRSGWRDGYTIGAEIDAATDFSGLAGYTKFTVREQTSSIAEAERMYDRIVEAKASRHSWRKFDFEAPAEWIERFKAGGRSAQASRRDLHIAIDAMGPEEIVNEIVMRAGALKP